MMVFLTKESKIRTMKFLSEDNNYILTNLSERPDCYNDFVALIEHEFHYNQNSTNTHQFEIDFAPLVDTSNFENCYFYYNKQTDTVIATMAISHRNLIKKNFTFSVGIIGGVSTHFDFRKMGLFSKLLDHVICKNADKCGLFLLWSEHNELYGKFSFFRTGGSVQTGINAFAREFAPQGFIKTTFASLSENDFFEIQKLYSQFNEKYFFTIKRTQNNWEIIRKMESIDLYIKKNDQDEIIQYFCVNKGKDLIDIIHEVASTPENYLNLVANLSKFKLWLPESELSLSPNKELFFTLLARIGDLNILNEFISKVTSGNIFILDLNDNKVIYQYKESKYVHSHQDFLQYLFGPRPLQEFASYNLSIYIPGIDSV